MNYLEKAIEELVSSMPMEYREAWPDTYGRVTGALGFIRQAQAEMESKDKLTASVARETLVDLSAKYQQRKIRGANCSATEVVHDIESLRRKLIHQPTSRSGDLASWRQIGAW